MPRDENYQDVIHVVCAADPRYSTYAGIVMQSIVGRKTTGSIHFHLLSDGIAISEINKFKRIADQNNCLFSSYDIARRLNELSFSSKLANHLSRTAYARIFFEAFLPDSVHRIIYLDCDIICQEDISRLWEKTEGIKLLGAVTDPWLNQDELLKASLGIAKGANYYNSGVLVINVDEWKKSGAESRLKKYILDNGWVKHADQDAINAVFANEIEYIDSKWNTLIDLPDKYNEAAALEAAALIHFVGGFKPWHFGYGIIHPAKYKIYKKFKVASPWKHTMPDLHINRFFRKFKMIRRPLTGGSKTS